MKGTIKTISISGFKSIRELRNFQLRDLNIMIGANGAGKSNFVQIFRLLMAMAQKNLQEFIQVNGGADNFLHNGPRHTSHIEMEFDFWPFWPDSDAIENLNSYCFTLTRTVDGTFLIKEKEKHSEKQLELGLGVIGPCTFKGPLGTIPPQLLGEDEKLDGSWISLGAPSLESRLCDKVSDNVAPFLICDTISHWMAYHFHDTSATAPMRTWAEVMDNQFLRDNGGNIAPFLRRLRDDGKLHSRYQEIVRAVRLAMPFFDDFRLDTKEFRPGEEKVRLSWRQRGSDFPMQPYHLSDGSIRFICLATALLQPDPPSTIVIDEPELGLHPEAIALLAELI